MDKCVFLVIQFALVTEIVIEVFAIYVHATLSNGCAVHASIMGTNTRWKTTKCDVTNFLFRSSLGQKRNNNTKSRIRKEVHPGNNSSYIPCTLPLIAVIFGGCLTTSTNLFAIPKRRDSFGMCWLRMSPQNMLKYPRWGEKSSRGNGHVGCRYKPPPSSSMTLVWVRLVPVRRSQTSRISDCVRTWERLGPMMQHAIWSKQNQNSSNSIVVPLYSRFCTL